MQQYTNDPEPQSSSCCTAFEDRVRENPTHAILVALGVGIAAGLVARALSQPSQPRHHVKQLLEDIQERLHDLADPALGRLHEFAEEGNAALKKGACRVEGVHQRLRSLSGKLGNLFH